MVYKIFELWLQTNLLHEGGRILLQCRCLAIGNTGIDQRGVWLPSAELLLVFRAKNYFITEKTSNTSHRKSSKAKKSFSAVKNGLKNVNTYVIKSKKK